MAAVQKTDEAVKSFTLKVNGEIYDSMIHRAYKTGDVVEEITPFLQLQINEGLVEVTA